MVALLLAAGWCCAGNGSLQADEPAATPAAELARAERLLLKGRYAEAGELFQQAAAAEPIRAAHGQARCRQAVGESSRAVELLQAALGEQLATGGEADLLRELLAELAAERGDYEEATRLLEPMRQAERMSPRGYWIASQCAYAAGELERVEALCESASEASAAGGGPLDLAGAEGLLAAGRARALLARWRGEGEQYRLLVQRFYPALLSRRPDFWPARLEMARLFAEKFNAPAAVDALNQALAVNASAGEIYLLRAEIAVDEFDLPSARRDARRALAANAELLAGYGLLADTHLAEFQFAEAIAALEQGRSLNPRDETILGRLAAAYRARDGAAAVDGEPSTWQAIEAEVLKRNSHCGRFYRTLGDALDRMRKYPQAAAFYRRAAEVMPGRARVEAPLGMIAMRLGDEAEATELLEAAFARDPFNIRVKNTLEVLDVLAGYAVLETEHFVLRFDRGQDQVMAEAAAEYLEEVYPLLVERLGYEPPAKSLIEIFSRSRSSSGHAWFSARMVGLPYIGTVGACAGKMAAMVSPNDGRQFHWARVLRHEFVHVVNLQQTDFNIPHWYTEALAVWNEDRPRPPAWRTLLARRHARGDLFDLDTINMGFIRPGSGDNWTLAYCQAELYAEYLVEQYGEASLGRLLAAYGDNLTTEAALRRCFDVSQADFERGYREFLAEVVERESPPSAAEASESLAELEQAAEADPENAERHARLALARLRAGSYTAAKNSAARALGVDAGNQLAHYVIGALLVKVDRADSARELLARRLNRQRPEPHSLWLLATLALEAEQYEQAAEYFQLGRQRLSATRPWLTGLSQVYQKTNNRAGTLDILQELAEHDDDNLELRQRIVSLAEQLDERAIAGRYAEDACYIDPQLPELWAVAALWHAAEGRHAKAARRYRWALQLESGRDRWRLAMIDSLMQNQQFDEAAEALAPLAERKPADPEVIRLQKEIERGGKPDRP